jgi:excisionase family DNA binding protein
MTVNLKKGSIMKNKNEITPKEAARMLGVRLDHLYPLIWAGKLEARKVDGRWLIPQTAVQTLAEKRMK